MVIELLFFYISFASFPLVMKRKSFSITKDHHGHHRKGYNCIYSDCLTVFQSFVEPKCHLKQHWKEGSGLHVAKICCELCTFSEPTNIQKYFLHLKKHLRNKETVFCPFGDYTFNSSVLSRFTVHRSHYHQSSTLEHFKPKLIVKRSGKTFVNDEQWETEDVAYTDLFVSVQESERDNE